MKDAYYFPHDSNAIDDPKIMVMVSEMGLEAYAIYWILIEHLRQQPGFIGQLSILRPLALRHGSTEAKFTTVVSRYELFIIDDKTFYSNSLMERMQPYLDKSERARKAALKRWGGDSNANALQMQSGSNASKVKEIKVKENKVEGGKRFAPPTQEEVKDYFQELLKKETDQASRFIDFYISKNWMVGKNKMKDWRAAVRNWIRRMDEQPGQGMPNRYDPKYERTLQGNEISQYHRHLISLGWQKMYNSGGTSWKAP